MRTRCCPYRYRRNEIACVRIGPRKVDATACSYSSNVSETDFPKLIDLRKFPEHAVRTERPFAFTRRYI